MAASIMQKTKRCYITHSTQSLHKHHIFEGTANRSKSEQYGCWVWLRSDLHNMSDYGVHGRKGNDLDRMLKQTCQRRFERIYGHEMFVETFGKSYL